MQAQELQLLVIQLWLQLFFFRSRNFLIFLFFGKAALWQWYLCFILTGRARNSILQMYKRSFSRKTFFQVQVSVDLLVGVRKPQLYLYCSLLNSGIFSKACFSASVQDLWLLVRLATSILHSKMEAGVSHLLLFVSLKTHTHTHTFCTLFLIFHCSKKTEDNRMRYCMY